MIYRGCHFLLIVHHSSCRGAWVLPAHHLLIRSTAKRAVGIQTLCLSRTENTPRFQRLSLSNCVNQHCRCKTNCLGAAKTRPPAQFSFCIHHPIFFKQPAFFCQRFTRFRNISKLQRSLVGRFCSAGTLQIGISSKFLLFYQPSISSVFLKMRHQFAPDGLNFQSGCQIVFLLLRLSED